MKNGMDHTLYTNAREDLAKIIAQEVSGLEEALPDQDDYELADVFIKLINSEKRHVMPRSEFQSRLESLS